MSVRPSETSRDQTISHLCSRRRSICHLCWSLTDILPPLCRRSSRHEQPTGKNPWQSSNPPPIYPTYREYRSLFAAAWNNKAFAPSSHPKRHLSHIWCNLRTPSIRLNEMAWFTGFSVNAVKSTSGKQGDLCMRESNRTTGIYDSPVPRPPPFLSTPTRPAIIRFGTR